MSKGFSLIELMIVIVIIAILATLAYPGYRDYITRARRTDGHSALLDLASRLEHYYSEQNTYQTATIGTGGVTDVRTFSTSPEGWYSLSITEQTPSTFTISATPRNAQAIDDRLCQNLTLNSLGIKGITTGPAGTPTGSTKQCW
ncbi:MAG: type IV pilin protein [Legionella sp.]|nr:type IV pilin protein [Legionella sp.]